MLKKNLYEIKIRNIFCILFLLSAFLISNRANAQSGSDTTGCGKIYVAVQRMPQLKGGLDNLQKEVRYPDIDYKAGIEGRVYVDFIVTKEGFVFNPYVDRGIEEHADREALRVVKAAKFQPGTQNDDTLCVRSSLSIVYKLTAHTPIAGHILDRSVTVNEPFLIVIPSSTFYAADSGAIHLTGTLANYADLPAWLTFTDHGDGSGTFSGTPVETGKLIIEVTATNKDTLSVFTSFELDVKQATAIESERAGQPQNTSLMRNYPNPFNPSTVISYNLKQFSTVKLQVYNSLGQKVVTLVNSTQTAGNHKVTFDASGLNSGLYFYKLQAGDFAQSKKMMLIK